MLTVLAWLSLAIIVVALGAAMALRVSDVMPQWAQALVNLLTALQVALWILWIAAAALHALIDLVARAGGA